jgi:cytochrome c-type biogenesis protein CcmH
MLRRSRSKGGAPATTKPRCNNYDAAPASPAPLGNQPPPYFKRSLFQTFANISKQRLMISLVFALLTGTALLSVLAPLAQKKREMLDPAATDVAFFKDQIAEIDREATGGQIAPHDAEIAKTEAARRLLKAQSAKNVAATSSRKVATFAALATIVLVPALSLALYSRLGRSDMPDMPLSARLQTPPDHINIADAVGRIEAHLAQHPEDGRGFEVVAPYYMRTGRFDDAVHAYGEALRLLGATAARHAALGEARTLAGGGVVTEAANQDFEAALAQEPTQPTARFYLGLAAAQNGERDKAREIWSKMLAEAPDGAPWVERVKMLLAKLDETSASSAPRRPRNRVRRLRPCLRVSGRPRSKRWSSDWRRASKNTATTWRAGSNSFGLTTCWRSPKKRATH